MPHPVLYIISSALHNPYQGKIIFCPKTSKGKDSSKVTQAKKWSWDQSQADSAHFLINLLALGGNSQRADGKEEASKVW